MAMEIVRRSGELLLPRPAPARDELGTTSAMFSSNLRKESFKIFYQKHSRPFWLFVRKTCGEDGLADDIFQESFIRFLNHVPDELNVYQQKSFLYKTAYRLIIDQKRRIDVERKYQSLLVADDQEAVNPLVSLDMDRIFQRLKPKERTLLWLACVEDFSHREIARLTGDRESSIRVQLFRVKKKFAAFLQESGFSGKDAP